MHPYITILWTNIYDFNSITPPDWYLLLEDFFLFFFFFSLQLLKQFRVQE